jgi:hypothetical protein
MKGTRILKGKEETKTYVYKVWKPMMSENEVEVEILCEGREVIDNSFEVFSPLS